MNDTPAKKLAFLFPGQGSQAVGMGFDLHEHFPIARETFQEADEALGFSLSQLCFEGPEDDLKLTENTQPAILAVSVAAHRVLAEHGIQPAMAAGHSLGEYSAHVAAGTFSFADAVRAVRNRGRHMQGAVPAGEGAMAAVLGLPPEQVADACAAVAAAAGVVQPANYNSPEQTVISGATAAVEAAVKLLKERGAKRTVMLPVSAPFHCKLMEPAERSLAADFSSIAFAGPRIPVLCNVDVRWVQDADVARETLIRQVTGAVRWVECEQALIAAGATHFLEVGPGRVLCGLLRQLDRAQMCFGVENVASLEKTLAGLAA